MTILNFDKLESKIRTLGGYINFNFTVDGTDEEQNKGKNNAFVRYDFNHKYYLFGTNNSITGYYYPLYIKAPSENEDDYSIFTFLEYPGISFYMINTDKNIGEVFKPTDSTYLNFLTPYYIYGTGVEGTGYFYPVYSDLPSKDSSKYSVVRFDEYDKDFYTLNNYYKKAETDLPDENLFKRFVERYYVYGTQITNNQVGNTGYFYPAYVEAPSSNSDDYTVYNFKEYPGIDFYILNSEKNEGKTSKPSKLTQLDEYVRTGWYASTLKFDITDISNKLEIIPNEIAFITSTNDSNDPDVESVDQVKLLEQKTLEEIQARALVRAYRQEWTYGYDRTYIIKSKFLQFIDFKIYKIENNHREYVFWDYFKNLFKSSKNKSISSLFRLFFYKDTCFIKLIQNLHEKILLIDKTDDNNHVLKFEDNNIVNLKANLNNKLNLLPYQITKDSTEEITDDTVMFTIGTTDYYIDYVY